MACSLGSPVEPQYSGQQEAWQSTVNSQGSCFPVLVSVVVCVKAVGKALPPFPLRNENPSIPQRGELLSAFLLPLSFLSKMQSAPSVPCFRFLRLATAGLQSSRPARSQPRPGFTAAVVGGVFICLTPQLQSSAPGLRIVASVLAHFSLLCKVCTPQQLLLISVSHWCRSFLYCKETYLRLLMAVWFGALLQTPSCSGARSLGGCGCHCPQSSGQRCMS